MRTPYGRSFGCHFVALSFRSAHWNRRQAYDFCRRSQSSSSAPAVLHQFASSYAASFGHGTCVLWCSLPPMVQAKNVTGSPNRLFFFPAFPCRAPSSWSTEAQEAPTERHGQKPPETAQAPPPPPLLRAHGAPKTPRSLLRHCQRPPSLLHKRREAREGLASTTTMQIKMKMKTTPVST